MQKKFYCGAGSCVLHLVTFLAEYGTWISFLSVPAGKRMIDLNKYEV
jgi:hypothetical protein